jgi:murein DD-endopeptidase MepM/ murein hydrolase activator NlpD
MWTQIKKLFTRRFTLMVISHGAGTTRQLNLQFSVIVIFLLGWTAITFLGTYLSAQHIDYWRTQVSNQVLKMKVKYLVGEIDRTRGFLEEVKQIEVTLRQMLNLNTKDMNAQNSKKDKNKLATGGPTEQEQDDVTKIIEHYAPDFTWTSLLDKVFDVKSETKNRLDSYDKLAGWLNEQRHLYYALPQGWPCSGRRTSHFGKRIDPFKKVVMFHFGVDIAAPQGTPIRATGDGKVRLAGWSSGYGNLVVLEHEFGYQTRYAHNKKILVKVGDEVKRGQILALMGQTGKATAPHCHYEVWKNGHRKNPYTYMIGESVKINALSKIPEEELKFNTH